MVTFYGRRTTSSEADYGTTSAGQLRASVFNAAGSHLWCYGLGVWIGRSGASSPSVRLAVWDSDTSKNPTNRVGYSAAFTAGTAYAGAGGGASHEPAVAVADNGPTNAALKLYAGRRYALGYLGTVAGVGHSMRQASAITADNEQFYNRSGLAQPPPAPFGVYSASVEGHLSIWALCDVNVAPEVPTSLSPSGAINSTAPTFAADFLDQNAGDAGGTDRGDMLSQYKVQVRRVSDGLLFWDATYTALAAEQAADAISRAYGGTTLVRGTAYEWRVMMSDQFDAWSAWTAWTPFTPASLGFVTLDGAPVSKIESATPNFSGRWTHQTATSMARVQVRLLSAGGTVLQTGADYDIADVASSASPGTLFTAPWANTGFTNLSWGTAYQYQIRGYDGTVWSDWSAARSFTTDAYPNTPSGLAPTGSQITTTRPALTFTMADSDDTVATGLLGAIHLETAVSVDNPTFAVDATGWSANGETAGVTVASRGRATDQLYSGASGSYKISVSANSALTGAVAKALNSAAVLVTPNLPSGVVNVRGYGRTSTTDVSPCLAVAFYDASLVFISEAFVTFISTAANTWTELAGFAAVPANAAYGKLDLCWRGDINSAIGDVWFYLPRLDGYRLATYDAGTDRWSYQTTVNDLPIVETHSWKAWGNDGTLNGAFSASSVFVFAVGPVITITAPTEAQTLTSSSVTVSWTVGSGGPQVKYRVRLYADNSATLVYDSGLLTSVSTTHVIPSGYVRNDTQYDLTVTVENATPLQGTSTIRNFSIDYVDPDPVANVVVGTIAYATDPWDTAVRISWDQTEYATPTWQEYTITRRAASGPDQSEIILARITSPSQTAYVDNAPASGIEYTYGIKQVIFQGVDTLSSVAVEGAATVDLGGVVLSHATLGGTYRSVLRVAQQRGHDHQRQEAVYHPVSGNGPLTIRNKTYYRETDITAKLTADEWATAAQKRAELETLDALLPAATVAFRDDEGRKWYAKIASLHVDDEMPDWFTVRLRLRQESFIEGVVE